MKLLCIIVKEEEEEDNKMRKKKEQSFLMELGFQKKRVKLKEREGVKFIKEVKRWRISTAGGEDSSLINTNNI